MLTGGVKEAADAERLLREDAADLIGIGRELLKDPRWAVRALETIRHNL
jgi:2,4-dienoyl-CoA reductase-like NADH-dependent reductase (Old Yellow Enzyme family)